MSPQDAADGLAITNELYKYCRSVDRLSATREVTSIGNDPLSARDQSDPSRQVLKDL